MATSVVNKNLSRVKYCSRACLFRYRHVTLNRLLSTIHYFNDKQMNKSLIYQLDSGEFPFAATCSEEDDKGPGNCKMLCFTSKRNKHSLIVAFGQEI